MSRIVFEALPSLKTVAYSFPVDTFLRPGIDLDQPYQRGLVWGLQRKRNLLRSILMGLPIGSITTNNRLAADFTEDGYDQGRCWATAVIDGKQRISTLREFTEGGFAVPAAWWREKDVEGVQWIAGEPMVWWQNLTRTGQRRIENTIFPTNQACVATLADEQAIFDLINFGGVAQGDTDTDK